MIFLSDHDHARPEGAEVISINYQVHVVILLDLKGTYMIGISLRNRTCLILQDLRGAEVIAINEHIRGQIASSPSRNIVNPKVHLYH